MTYVDLIKSAFSALKKNYWVIICVCALLVFLEIVPGNGTMAIEASTAAVTGNTAAGTAGFGPGLIDYLGSVLEGDTARAQAIAKDVMKGFNGTGGNIYGVMRAVDQFIFSSKTLSKVLAVVVALITLAYGFFVKNALLVGFDRFCINALSSGKKELKFSSLFDIFRAGAYKNVVKVMALRSIMLDIPGYIALGFGYYFAFQYVKAGLTGGAIASGIICAVFLIVWILMEFSFMMTTYALGTNPYMKTMECVNLSKNMMKKRKAKVLLLCIIFALVEGISVFFGGLLDLLLITPIKYLTFAKFFAVERERAIDENLEYSYLVDGDRMVLRPEAFDQDKLADILKTRNPMRDYSLVNIVLFFFIFAFIGWSWEVLIHIVKDGEFINRGTMHGPWLPIYGFGGAGIIVFLRKLAKKPFALVVSIFVGCGILEYVAHWYLELTKNMKWWDYSNYFLNLNGRICFEGLAVFCIAGVAAVYFIGPLLDDKLNKYPEKKKWTVAVILTVIFCIDAVYSHFVPNAGKGITDYGKDKK